MAPQSHINMNNLQKKTLKLDEHFYLTIISKFPTVSLFYVRGYDFYAASLQPVVTVVYQNIFWNLKHIETSDKICNSLGGTGDIMLGSAWLLDHRSLLKIFEYDQKGIFILSLIFILSSG